MSSFFREGNPARKSGKDVMKYYIQMFFQNVSLLLPCLILILFSFFILSSITPEIYPNYFVYIGFGILILLIFIKIPFDVLLLFANHLYILSILLLIIPLVFGNITRGTVRWIPIGPITLQPSEIVRPFLILFFAKTLTAYDLTWKTFIKSAFYLALPVSLIFIQPSLGVAVITLVGYFGVLLASSLPKKYLAMGLLAFITLIPLFWLMLAPYQKQRVMTFINPSSDPYGTGYNSIQSVISVGSGKLFGRGLGEGVQTQLAFLPEKHTDFILAAISEELGFVGALLVVSLLYYFFFQIIKLIENPRDRISRAFASGVLAVFFFESGVHIGMNLGLLPITGIPLPFVSAGGSALLASLISLGILISSRNMNLR